MQIRWLLPFLVAMTIPASAQFSSFNVEGSTGTSPSGINASGAISGTYSDASFAFHGFVRDPRGNITSFDPTGSVSTIAASINANGAITGNYESATFSYHGFVRNAQGDITPFDPAGSVDTQPFSINASGATTGYYLGTPGGYHGFVRDAQGNITSFDPVGSISTAPNSINDGGAIAGSYQNATSTMMHGFVRDAQGNITSFDPPGSTETEPAIINASGVIAGSYFDAASLVHGFIRDAQGNITSFDPAGSTLTSANGINATGAITGWYINAAFAQYGFVRDPQGNTTSFEVPGGPYPGSINDSGAIVGGYQGDEDHMTHGFVARIPNTMDISNGTGAVSTAVWQNAQHAGVSNVLVQAWGGGSQNSLAEAQLLGAQSAGLNTGAYILLNYFAKDSAAYQIGQGIDAIGSAISDLKFIVVDVEICCGEFMSWKAFTTYALNSVIMDPANHIQKATTAGTSGPTAPAWNDANGTPADGTVVWQDTGKVVIGQADRIARISAAVSAIRAYNLPHGAVIYTDPNKSWQTITGSCGTGWKNNCASLIALPLWDVEYKAFYGGDGLLHCGDGVAGLVPFTPFTFTTWQARSGNQYDLGLYNPASSTVAPSWDEYELGLPPAAKRACGGETNLFGLPASSLGLDYFDPTLFQ